jgi:hypothetical protein
MSVRVIREQGYGLDRMYVDWCNGASFLVRHAYISWWSGVDL